MTWMDAAAVAASWVFSIVCLGLIIGIHELGHFVAAKRLGLKVDQFGVGIGRKIFSFKRGDTEFSLRWLPVGGFVSTSPDTPIENLTKPKQAIFYGAGIAANVFLALSLFFVIGTRLVRLKAAVPEVLVSNVGSGLAAEKAGVKQGDGWLKINGSPVNGFPAVVGGLIANSPNKIVVDGLRDGKVASWTIEKLPGVPLGVAIAPGAPYLTRPFQLGDVLKASVFSLRTARRTIVQIGAFIEHAVETRSLKNLGGPIGIIKGASKLTVQDYWTSFLVLWAAVSLQVGLFNLLPFPVLDGGYLVMIAIEGMIGRAIDKGIKEKLIMVGGLVLIGLTVMIVFADIIKL